MIFLRPTPPLPPPPPDEGLYKRRFVREFVLAAVRSGNWSSIDSLHDAAEQSWDRLNSIK